MDGKLTMKSDRPFLCIDEIEDSMRKLTIDMTPWELITYLKGALKALYGIELIAEGKSEPGIMGRLQATYGQHDAGLIIKWVVWRYWCRDSANPGQYVKFNSFAKGRKWWVDTMHAEMQEQVRKETIPATPVVQSAVTSAWL